MEMSASSKKLNEKRHTQFMDEEYIKKSPMVCSYRLILSVILCFGVMHLYSLRFNITVVLECMVNRTAAMELKHVEDGRWMITNLTNAELCEIVNDKTDDIDIDFKLPKPRHFDDGDFYWSSKVQNIIQSSFFWGYLTTQIPAGVLSRRHGGKKYFGWSMFLCGVFTLLMPVAARTGYNVVVLIRVLIGACQGVMWPAVFTIWSRWAPPLERQRLIGFSFAGLALGIAITYPLATTLCKSEFGGGWESIFFMSGSLAIVWSFLWGVYGFDSPAEHPKISNKEKMYIETTLKSDVPLLVEVDYSTPWGSIMTSKPFWGIIIVNASSDLSTYGMIMCIFTYMQEVLYIDPEESGSFSALPYIGLFFGIVFSGFAYDFVIGKQMCSKTVARKISVCAALLIPGGLIASVGFVGCSERFVAIAIVIIGIAISGIQFGAGFATNIMDIAPPHAGVMFAISNSFGSFSGMIFLHIAEYITVDKTQEQWRKVFFLLAGVNVLGSIVYAFLGSGEVQRWSRMSIEDNADLIARSSPPATEACTLNESVSVA